jgi:hypothetical protein
MSRIDISVVATFHREGAVAVPTLKSIGLCRDAAQAAGLRVEVIATLDRADRETRETVQAWHRTSNDTRVLELDFGDLGLARNAGFAVAAGTYGSTMDGDDLLSPGWLVRAYKAARLHSSRAVVHPEYVIEFGAGAGFTRLQDMHPSSGLVWALLATHPWTSCGFAPLQAYRDAPYLGSTGRWSGFGFEDWHWNLEQLALGRSHVVARHTFLLYRKRPNSLLAEQISENRLVGPLTLFTPDRVLMPQGHTCSRRGDNGIAAWVRSVVQRVCGKPGNPAVVPSWALPELKSLHGLDAAVPSTRSTLKSHHYWEPKLNAAIGAEYRAVVRQLCTSDAGPVAGFAVAESAQAVAAALAETAGKVLVLSRPPPALGGKPSTSPWAQDRAIQVPSDTALEESEVEALLARLIVQLRPACVQIEPSARLAAIADRYAVAFRSLGVQISLTDWSDVGSLTTTIEN